MELTGLELDFLQRLATGPWVSPPLFDRNLVVRLIEREYAARHPNRPGERGERFAQLLGSSQAEAPPEHAESPWADDAGLESRIARLEDEVARLWDALEGREN